MYSGNCARCGTAFTTLQSSRKFCSQRCREKARDSRRFRWGGLRRWQRVQVHFISAYKLLSPCGCGEIDPVCLQFHHRNPEEKSFGISDLAKRNSVSWAALFAEVEKCDVLCSNCHLRHHHEQRELFKTRKLIPPVWDLTGQAKRLNEKVVIKQKNVRAVKRILKKIVIKKKRKVVDNLRKCRCGQRKQAYQQKCNSCWLGGSVLITATNDSDPVQNESSIYMVPVTLDEFVVGYEPDIFTDYKRLKAESEASLASQSANMSDVDCI